jgi:D-3-phosphoglycerate dehydrogenase / 2-oxoglutarate reductase
MCALRILLTHTPEMRSNYFGEGALARLRAVAEVSLHEGADPLDTSGLIAAAKGCHIVVIDRATACDGSALAQLPELSAVCRVAVDIRNIDVAAASRHGILITHAGRSWLAAVSELVIGLMLDAARGISRANIAYKRGEMPEVEMGRQLAGSTAGIIGYGPLGRCVAELALAFGMHVLVSDPYVIVEHDRIEQVDLADLLRRADFVLPLAAATAETENLIDRHAIGRMRSDAFLINLSRGNLIDESALLQALEEKRIAGAAMDVGRAADQMPTPRLAQRLDVVATPHIGGLTEAAVAGQALETVAQVAKLARGEVPPGAINAEAASRLARLVPASGS